MSAAPQTAAQWSDSLSLLATNWLKEADVTYQVDERSQYGRRWQYDRYGNYFIPDDDNQPSVYRYQGSSAQPISTGDLLPTRPSEKWIALIREDLKPKFAESTSKLYLKANEEKEAFPFIEQLAKSHPDRVHELAQEFLRVWTRNHNPNEQRDSYRPFFYYWGYEQRAERIPLTRSKQERNLVELADWIKRLRALPIGKLDETLLTSAFTTCHSRAEVYQVEAFEKVFGNLDVLEPRTLAELIQQMRGNLVTVWQAPDVQKQNSTNRKQKDMEAEVLRGYEVAKTVVQKGLQKHPDHWALLLAQAAILHDENDYQQSLKKTSDFSPRRGEALARFQTAATQYARSLSGHDHDEESTQVYEQWFYAGLGAVDIGRITDAKVPDLKQPALIRQAILALPPDAAERHMSKFANSLFSRMSSAKAELKFRYLRRV